MITQRSVCLIFYLFLAIGGVKSDRKVTAELNPGCTQTFCKNGKVILVHVKAEGSDDILHHFWDFTGQPTLLLALADKNSTVSILWQTYETGSQGAISITPSPEYVYGVVVDKLIEFNDENDSGVLDQNVANSSYITQWDTKIFDWKTISLTNTSGDATLTVEATSYFENNAAKNMSGTFRFEMKAYGGEDHGEILPHLLHSGNASQMDIILDHINTKYQNSRFGLHFVTVSSEKPNNTVEISPRKTMDDEHAPGVFTIVEMVTPNVKSGKCGGYLQWRPVVYLSPAREMTASTESVQYSVMNVDDTLSTLDHTLIYSILGDQLVDMLVVATNVTFGVAEDGFYAKNRYAAWTVIAGYGHPPEESFSMLVTLVLLLGLGLPAILILTGTVCIVFRRLQRNKDDLFLTR